MKNKILLFILLGFTAVMVVRAQTNVGSSNAPTPSAMLQVSGTLRGFLPPVVTTAQRNLIAVPAAGLLIFNSTTTQMEVNTGTPALPIWTPTTGNSTVAVAQPIDVARLGYYPSSSATAIAAQSTFSITVSGISTTYTKYGGFTSSVNHHSYAIYRVSAGTPPTWFGAYFAAASLGGYLGTFTSLAEWNSVLSSLLNPYGASNTMWIGMAKMSWRAGTAMTADVIDWITGEHSALDYYTGASSSIFMYNNFVNGQPDNSGATEGFIQIAPTTTGRYSTGNPASVGTLYGWNDISAATAQAGFVIEFNQ